MKLANNLTFENTIATYEDQFGCSYDSQQIEELRKGYNCGLNVEAYADPSINWYTMFSIRREIEHRLQYLSNAKDQCRFAQWVFAGFDSSQLDELTIGLSKGLDVEKYANMHLSCEEMHVIRRGLEMGIDTSKLVYEGRDLQEIYQKLGVDNYYEIDF